MMTKEGSTKIVKIMTPRAGFLMLGLGHISHYSDNVVSSTLLIYRTLVAIMMLLSYTIIDFHLFYDGTVDIQILAPLTRSQCKVSDTQVTVKTCGPLVFIEIDLKIFSFYHKYRYNVVERIGNYSLFKEFIE